MASILHLPKVSIVVPIYQSSATLERCLRSILTQDYPAELLEVIVVDGGSTDHGALLARRLGFRNVIQNPYRSGEAAKAIGLACATGEFVAFIDSDNILTHSGWLVQMIESMRSCQSVAAEPLYYT